MRSASLAWLLERKGMDCFLLEGGYKSFRTNLRSCFSSPFQFLVLGGMTGTGKTEILGVLKSKGQQIINLEKIASHKGSAFGALGESTQPTNEQFENNLFVELENVDTSRTIWIEDESKNIGRLLVPAELYQQMFQARLLLLDVPSEKRVQRLVAEYGKYPDDLLIGCIQKISRRLGGLDTQRAIDAVKKSDYRSVARITLRYYDKTYSYSLNKRFNDLIYPVHSNEISAEWNAEMLLDFARKNNLLI